MIENRQCFVNIIAAICIFLFILLQYEESRFSRGPPIENYINSTFKMGFHSRLYAANNEPENRQMVENDWTRRTKKSDSRLS